MMRCRLGRRSMPTGDRVAEASPDNPYPGPRPFVAGERLHGRDREVTRLFYLLSAERIVVLHSPSGAGKSSLLNAGLVPRLRAERFYPWPPIRLSQPAAGGGNRFVRSAVGSLEEGLPEGLRRSAEELDGQSLAEYVAGRPRRPGAPASVVLVFDQFEEILTLDPLGVEARKEFFGQLGQALENPEVWALFALREDYLGALDPYRDDVPTRLANTFRLDLLTVAGAREAIAQPARDAGREFTAEAAEQLAGDLATITVQQPDGSFEEQTGIYVEPLQLQVVCRRLWDELPADTRTIGIENLLASGDVDAALAAYYDRSLAEIAGADVPAERGLREWFGERLITAGGIRGQVLREQSASGGLDNASVDRLVATHLVRAEQRDEKTWFELAHDRLVAPVGDSNSAWFEQHLHPMQRQAALWDREGRPDSLLLRGQGLKEAEHWAGEHPAALRHVEEAFLAGSRAKRRATRLKLGALVLVTALVAVAAAAFLREWRNAVRAKHAAQSQELAAESRAQLSTAPQAALARAVEAFEARRTPQAEAALREAILANPVAYVIPPSKAAAPSLPPIRDVLTFSSDGRLLLGVSMVGSIHLWHARDGRPIALPRLPSSAAQHVDGVGFAGDVPLAHVESTRELVNLITGRRFDPGAGGTSGVTFHGSENRLLALEHDRLRPRSGEISVSIATDTTAAKVVRSASKQVIATIPGFGNLFSDAPAVPPGATLTPHTSFVPASAFSADDRLLAVANADGIVRVWELATLQQVMAVRAGWASAIAFAPSGGLLAAMNWEGAVVVARTSVRGALPGSDATFSPAGQLIAVGHLGVARLSSLDGRLETVLTPPTTGCAADASGAKATFSPDGSAVAVAATEVISALSPCLAKSRWGARVWRAGGGAESRPIWPGSFGHIELGRDGVLFVDEGKVWSVATASRIHELDGTLALSPDGHRAILARAGTVEVVRVPSGQPIAGLRDAGRPASAVFSPDGRRVLTSQKGALDLWDAATGRRLARLSRAGELAKAYSFGAGGRLVLALFNERAATFDALTGKSLTDRPGDFSALSDNGSVAVSARPDGTVEVVDLKTGVATVLQTGGAKPITAVHVGPDSSVIAAEHEDHEDRASSVVRVLRCEICAPADELLRRARATLALVSGFNPSRPPIAWSAVA